jgi:NAD-dependent dihydropyrimidine dehydrogenase PreA subunit
MPGLFVDVQMSAASASDAALARKLEEACPVDIFEATETGVRIVQENLDECILCDLCIKAAPPGAIQVVKLYERE